MPRNPQAVADQHPSVSEDDDVDMSDFDEVVAARVRATCHVGLLIERLEAENPKRAAALKKAVARPPTDLQHVEIEQVLMRWGISDVSTRSIGRHRIKRCKCHGASDD